MSLIAFLFEAGVISLSGVMAPGPLTTIVVSHGNRSPHAGIFIGLGHSLVEVPLMIAVFFGVGRLLDLPFVGPSIALAGGLFLLFMAFGMLQTVRQTAQPKPDETRSPVADGVLLSLMNPYFLVWWATVGVSLLTRSVKFGLIGLLAFALIHSLCDWVWYFCLSSMSFRGGQFFGRNFQRGVFLVCGVLLLVFGARLVWDGWFGIMGA